MTLSPYVGRSLEHGVVTGRLSPGALVAVIATPGTGCSRFALEAAHSAAADWPGGVHHVDLHRAPEPPRGVPDDRPGALWVLDGCDGLGAALAEPIAAARAAGSAVILTGHDVLGLPDTYVLALPPLPSTNATDLARGRLGDIDDADALAHRIAALCHGLPLAIELVADRVAADGPAALEPFEASMAERAAAGLRMARVHVMELVVRDAWETLPENARRALADLVADAPQLSEAGEGHRELARCGVVRIRPDGSHEEVPPTVWGHVRHWTARARLEEIGAR